ncbi:MAG: signal recognition particle-docking protein FtsY [Clostridia bacterium]
MGFFSKLFEGLKKTNQALSEKMKHIFTKNEISNEFYDELEFILISSDVGTTATDRILLELKEIVKKRKLKKAEETRAVLKEIMISILEENELSELSYPCIILVVGVNGVGKTTTIGKLAKKFTDESKNVVIAAGDTFRAAASEQLTVWADRSRVKIVKNETGADAGAVVFDAISSAKARNADVLIIDTAGRLHNKLNLMEELKKIDRIISREWSEACYHKFIVIDATTGQNALEQVDVFDSTIGLTDVCITKLDGTAKGGFLLSLCSEYTLPIRFVGVGESADDLIDFNAKEFVDSIL